MKKGERTTELLDRIEGVYGFIVKFKSKYDGNSPSVREIMRECDISSTSMVDYYLCALEETERIKRPAKALSRFIYVNNGQWSLKE